MDYSQFAEEFKKECEMFLEGNFTECKWFYDTLRDYTNYGKNVIKDLQVCVNRAESFTELNKELRTDDNYFTKAMDELANNPQFSTNLNIALELGIYSDIKDLFRDTYIEHLCNIVKGVVINVTKDNIDRLMDIEKEKRMYEFDSFYQD